MSPAKVIAEIGCNHKGNIDVALEMIMVAALFCKVDVVKFQKRYPRELLTSEEFNAPHPNQMHAYGPTYGAHREFLEFSQDQHKQLRERCNQFGIDYSTSVWDLTSAKEMVALEPRLLKIPSACNLHRELLAFVCDEFGGDIHVSLGMTRRDEEEELIEFFEMKHRAKDLVVYSCTSGYPVAFEDICLCEITRLREEYGSRVKAVGFSGHHLGIAADVAAMALGATWVERHFTLDRTWRGTDHSASLEPDGMRRLVRDIRHVASALEYKHRELLDVEEVQRKKLKRLSAN
jgi:sialic acid synthase